MDNNIIGFPGIDVKDLILEEEDADVAVKKVFEAAVEKDFNDIIIIGRLATGGFYLAATHAELADINWDLDKAKSVVMTAARMEMAPEEEE